MSCSLGFSFRRFYCRGKAATFEGKRGVHGLRDMNPILIRELIKKHKLAGIWRAHEVRSPALERFEKVLFSSKNSEFSILSETALSSLSTLAQTLMTSNIRRTRAE